MNVETSRALAEIMQTYGLTRLEHSEGDVRIVMERAVQTAPAAADNGHTAGASGMEESGAGLVDFNRLHEVKSPIVGVFYAAATPESPPFVSIGTAVKKGDVLCIVEAMKLMNEILAEQDGEIIDICLKNGDIAEYGQVLFKMI